MKPEEVERLTPDPDLQRKNSVLFINLSSYPCEIPINKCVIASLDERKTRKQEDVSRLAERINRVGFERTRAVWCTFIGGKYEVFAGGTRLEACRKLNLPTIPAIIFENIAEEEMAKLSHDDNVSDEYHVPVPITDMWAEYYHLNKDLGWTQEKIARAYDVTQQMVSFRINLYKLPDKIKDFTNRNLITESQLIQILPLQIDLYFSPWVNTNDVRLKCVEELVKNCLPGIPKTVKASMGYIDNWKSIIKEAETIYNNLKKVRLYDLTKDSPAPYEYDAPSEFVKLLSKKQAYSLSTIRAVGFEINNLISNNLRVYAEYQKTKSTEVALEAERLRKKQQIMGRVIHGDSREVMKRWNHGPIKLILTDPPYGKFYQGTKRRSIVADVLIGDDENAVSLTKQAIGQCIPFLTEEAHVIVFTDWQHEPEIRKMLADLGLTIRGQLIWVKENHSIGDVDHTFAPFHEVMVHATRGRPTVTPRLRDVFMVPRTHESNHPTEKPVELLRQLINSCSSENDVVLDPFGGSGSTLIAGMELHRDVYMIEIDEEYVDMALGRLETFIREDE